MSFTYDPTTERGKVRLLIHDTDANSYEFEDDEIDAFLEQNSDSVWLAAADACRSLAVKSTPTAFILSIPGAIELDKKQIAKIYLQMAREYETRASSGTDFVTEYIDSYNIEWDVLGTDETEYVGD